MPRLHINLILDFIDDSILDGPATILIVEDVLDDLPVVLENESIDHVNSLIIYISGHYCILKVL